MRSGPSTGDDFHPGGADFEESVQVIGWLKEHGLDMIELSMGGNTDDIRDAAPVEVDRSA